jgi:signal transduction histidine kinase/CheY-like chemotaxis protein
VNNNKLIEFEIFNSMNIPISIFRNTEGNYDLIFANSKLKNIIEKSNDSDNIVMKIEKMLFSQIQFSDVRNHNILIETNCYILNIRIYKEAYLLCVLNPNVSDITEITSDEGKLREKYEELSAVYEELMAAEEELKTNYRQLENAKEKAEQANIAKSQFLANMSHEVRTPLNGIMGTAELLSYTELNHQQKELLEALRFSSKLLLDTINNILDLSKIEAGKFEVNMEPFNLKTTLDRVISELSIACRKKKIELKYYIDPAIELKLKGDELKLNQVLINLVNNAIKFTESGEIDFKVKKLSQSIEKVKLQFSIKDTGIGIEESVKSQIFKKFVQQDILYTKKYSGSGLGLTISKELVKMMNGDIWFESKVDKGSEFYFTVEFELNCDSISIMEVGPKHKDNICSGQKVVLVVEDNEINMKVVTTYLKHMGYQYYKAYDGRQALDVLNEKIVDLILMDVQMPILNGYETTKMVRERERTGLKGYYTTIVAMTAYAMLGDRELCLENGMDDYISKPLELNKLKEVLIKYL